MRPEAGSVESLLEKIGEQRNDINYLRHEVSRLRGGLLVISEWKLPYPGFGGKFGSNGERDHFREIARKTLDEGAK